MNWSPLKKPCNYHLYCKCEKGFVMLNYRHLQNAISKTGQFEKTNLETEPDPCKLKWCLHQNLQQAEQLDLCKLEVNQKLLFGLLGLQMNLDRQKSLNLFWQKLSKLNIGWLLNIIIDLLIILHLFHQQNLENRLVISYPPSLIEVSYYFLLYHLQYFYRNHIG